ncbi:hypothetical protein H6P81_002178 [Aristolochia fimbriata]|uniref:Zinc finger PHD-type domain-containing protein n=1 Tax=Aristolochia fimbriata TaxID=158543 RepID=A0AAV7F930_ARIFI|nr:hypothetical protein H6P81_002178 [Aristolochia fimbriata]
MGSDHLEMTMNPSNGGGRKRKRGERVFGFTSFCHPGHPAHFDDSSSFQQNMQTLLRFGHVEDTLMKTWSFLLELCHQPALHLSLFVVEEPFEKSTHLHCHHCRSVGWGHHMICNRKYHLVVPSKETEPSKPTQKQSLLEVGGHLMHGVFHGNGFGHLLCINGFEMGSGMVTGSQIMDLWDRICSGLRARKVSLTDKAKKKGMELRLIHGLGYGEPWFGRWGYGFERGTYGVTQAMHHNAMEALRTIPMSTIIHHLGSTSSTSSSSPGILNVFSRYEAVSGYTLRTLGHLFRFMLELKIRLPLEPPATAGRREGTGGGGGCRWSSKRVETATRVIVESLKRAKPRWVSRQEVRDVARVSVGDTGLLDFVLKSLGNRVIGKYMVRRALNPATKVLEYCLEDISDLLHPSPGNSYNFNNYEIRTKSSSTAFNINRTQILKDIYQLYRYLFRNRVLGLNDDDGLLAGIQEAARVILDGKHLAKEYYYYKYLLTDPPRQTGIVFGDENHLIKLLCSVWLIDDQEEEEGANSSHQYEVLPPHEVIVIPVHATIKELKAQVERSFRETYWSLRTFVAEWVVEMEGAGDSDLVCGLVDYSGGRVVVAGRNAEKATLMYEGGEEEEEEGGYKGRVVDCHCGAMEDDGEALIACYVCDVWQHNRCVRVAENVSQVFICSRCESSIFAFSQILN